MILWTALALSAPDEDFLAAVRRMDAAAAQLSDATFRFHATEYVDGKVDAQSYQVKYRPPNTAYLLWDSGQEVLWTPETYDKLRVDPGRLMPVVHLDPHGRLAMRGNRHSIHRLGFVPLSKLLLADAERMVADLDRLRPTVEDLGTRAVHGQPARCYRAELRKDIEPALYAHRVEVCFHEATGLAIDLTVWDHEDGAVREVEHYVYEDLKVDVGLTEADFAAETYGL